MVFYRKYRPQTIEELDSAEVREKLYAVLTKLERIPHAFLFTGPKGLGKTSAARIIAKVLNCTADKKQRGTSGVEPCNTCHQCTTITNGTAMDVLEIDAASNRGIDEIRDLKEKIKLSPTSSRKKVYIIDEVHMLTTEAFNALLKTLEEPPEHAVLILCTTEPRKVPSTILSRTFHITFQKANTKELTRSFQRIITAEKLSVSEDGLSRIASLSEGGFRDGVKLLEELVSLADGKKITAAFIDQKYRITDTESRTRTCIAYLYGGQTRELLALINTVVEEGNDIRYLLEQIVQVLHKDLLQKAGVTTAEVSIESNMNLAALRQLLLLLTNALSQMRFAVLPQLPFEIAVIEWGELQARTDTEDVLSADEVETKLRLRESDADPVGNGVSTTVSVTTLRKQAGNMKKITALYGETEEKKKKPEDSPTANVSVLNFSAQGEITPEWLQEFWRCIIQDIKQHNHTLAGVLRGCMIKSFDRKNLVIEASYAFHREQLDNKKTKAILEQICRNLTGNSVSVTVELKS
jgi:DNA polymerase III subunit gamma/tau